MVMVMLVIQWLKSCELISVKKNSDGIIYTSDNQNLVVICDCCTKYTEWKSKHQTATKLLQKAADTPCYYKISDEQITVGI